MDENISPTSNIKQNSITIEDIKIFYKDRFIDFSKLPNSRYNTITNINISENIKFIGKIDSYDIWFETSSCIYLSALPNSPTRSWYKIKEINDIDLFQNYFNQTKQINQTNQINFAIRLEKMSFNEFARFVFLHSYTEKQIFESMRDLNHKIKNEFMTFEDEIRILNKFINSNLEYFYIKTKHSKSIIYCELIDNNNVFIKISYNELKLKNRYEKLPNFSPSDIGIIFSSFDLIFAEEIIKEILKSDSNSNSDSELIFNKIDILFKIHLDKNKLKKEICQDKIKSKEIQNYILNKINLLECDLVFSKIEKEGVFKAFENSFDILLETFYEKINSSEISQENSMYITNKLKIKIDEICKNKLI